MSLRDAVEEHWAGRSSSSSLASGLQAGAVAYGAITRVRNRLFDTGVLSAGKGSIPVVSVGNLTVGGTGKTPIVRWVVETLREAGHLPAVILRGYGGDETELHRRWYPDVQVIDAPVRLHGVTRAAKDGASVAVCDDAFQHRRLARDLDIVLIDALDQRPVRMLPAGPYRELPGALTRADVVLVVTKGHSAPPTDAVLARLGTPDLTTPVHSVGLGATQWVDLKGEPAKAPSGPVLIVAGVGSPNSVEALVRSTGANEVELLAFPDHHHYTTADVEGMLIRAAGRPIVTTEKDAVKLLHWNTLHDSTVVLQMGVQSINKMDALRQRILAVMRT